MYLQNVKEKKEINVNLFGTHYRRKIIAILKTFFKYIENFKEFI